jgi:bacillithiol system protein YtxJ
MSFLKRFRDVNAKEILGQWEELTEIDQIDSILEESKSQPVAIFKHSTSCGISHHVKSTLEEDWDFEVKDIKVYYLDLLAYRPISNEVAKRLNVIHQSPQFILIKNGEAFKDWSHYSISNKTIRKVV